MSLLYDKHADVIGQIERTIGRRLGPEALTVRPGIEALSDIQLTIARELATRQLVLGAIYLHDVAGMNLNDAKLWMDDVREEGR